LRGERALAADQHKFVGLDGVRGVGALCVVFAHIAYAEHVSDFFVHANAGVDLFFVLSGFVIAHAYDDALRTTMTLRAYLRVRFLRLYPTILLGAAAGFAVAAYLSGGASAQLWIAFALHALVIPTLGVTHHVFPQNVTYWSLFFELFANFLHAALAKHITEARLWFVIALGAVGLVYCAFHFDTLNIGWRPETFIGGFARVGYCFALGLLIHRYHAAGKLNATPRLHVFVPMGLLALAMWAPVPGWPYAVVLHDLFATLVFFPAIVIIAIYARVPARLAPFLTWLGLISYPLYAVHIPIMSLLSGPILPESVPHAVKALGWAGIVVLSVLAAWAAASLYEPRARVWLGRLWKCSRSADLLKQA
jgi:peptidoglycan/LPS O-acetylase OafA/YrhL